MNESLLSTRSRKLQNLGIFRSVKIMRNVEIYSYICTHAQVCVHMCMCSSMCLCMKLIGEWSRNIWRGKQPWISLGCRDAPSDLWGVWWVCVSMSGSAWSVWVSVCPWTLRAFRSIPLCAESAFLFYSPAAASPPICYNITCILQWEHWDEAWVGGNP